MTFTPYSKLLIAVRTGHGDCAALAYGAALARRNGARLLLRAFDDEQEPLPAQTAMAWLDTTVARLSADGLDVSGELIARKPIPEAMLADIAALQPDLVIKELRRESVLHRLFFTPEDGVLARRSVSPLLVVGEGSAGLPTRIIAAVDISASEVGDLNWIIVENARRFAQQTGAELHLAHVFEPIIDISEDAGLPVAGSSPMLTAEIQDMHRRRFEDIAGQFGVPDANRHLALGRTVASLEELCDRIGAQTLVVGGHDRNGLERLLMGSTSEGLLSHAKQNVLIVKKTPFD